MSSSGDAAGFGAKNWIDGRERPTDRAVPNIVDLSLCADARRALHRVVSQRGLGFFVKPGPGHGPRLDGRRIRWVVEAARRQGRANGRPAPCSSRFDPDALSRSRGVVRRELLRRIAQELVEAGL